MLKYHATTSIHTIASCQHLVPRFATHRPEMLQFYLSPCKSLKSRNKNYQQHIHKGNSTKSQIFYQMKAMKANHQIDAQRLYLSRYSSRKVAILFQWKHHSRCQTSHQVNQKTAQYLHYLKGFKRRRKKKTLARVEGK